jgi:hypothetical protein
LRMDSAENAQFLGRGANPTTSVQRPTYRLGSKLRRETWE